MADENGITEARLNITWSGQNGDYPDPVPFDSTDEHIKNIATEALRTGYVAGISSTEASFNDFVVDRFAPTSELPARIMLRPKTPFGRHLDGKFHGVVVKNKNNQVVPPDQWVVFLAKDNAVPAMLEAYKQENIRLGADGLQLAAVDELINRIRSWREEHPDLCKVPDTEVGEIQ